MKRQELISSMQGLSTTSGWDVLVSYDSSKLNELLKKSYDQKKGLQLVKIEIPESDPLTGEEIIIKFSINFQAPLLQFVEGVSGEAELSILISSGSYELWLKGAKAPARKGDLPKNKYTLKVVAPLAAINGDTKVPTESKDVIVFDDTKKQSQHIVVHVQNKKGTTFKLEPNPTHDDNPLDNPLLLQYLQSYFQQNVSELDYVISGLSNTQQDKKTNYYTPKSFIFSGVLQEDKSFLSVYIQTKESGNPQGSNPANFSLNTIAVSPIPDENSFSIIFANDFIVRKVFSEQFHNEGISTEVVTADQGFSVKLKKDFSVVTRNVDPKYNVYSVTGLSVSLEDNPLLLHINNEKMSLKWSQNFTSNWDIKAGAISSGSTEQWGIVYLDIKLSKDFQIKIDANENIDFPSIEASKGDFNVKMTSYHCAWYQYYSCKTAIPSFYHSNLDLRTPVVNLNFPSINYFKESNILIPEFGKLNIDTKSGIGTPHDFIIVGEISF